MWHDELPNPAEYGTMPDGYRTTDKAALIFAVKEQMAKGVGPSAVDIYNGMLQDGTLPILRPANGSHVAFLLDSIAGLVAKGEASMDMEAAIYMDADVHADTVRKREAAVGNVRVLEMFTQKP